MNTNMAASKANIPRLLKKLPFEAFCWMAALLALALRAPDADHFALCPLQNAGLTFCPGCGLGRSVTLLFHGDLLASFEMHPLGIFAVIVLSFRIIDLLNHYQKQYGQSYRRTP